MPKIYKDDISLIFSIDFDPAEQNKIYKLLGKVNIRDAFKKEDKYSVELGIISLFIQKYLEKIKRDPDLIYIETSLVPEKTISPEKIVDFIYINVIHPEDDPGRKKVVRKILEGYNSVYKALHKTGKSIYYIPDFFLKPKTIEMAFSMYEQNCLYKFSKDIKQERDKRIQEIENAMKQISKENLKFKIKNGITEKKIAWDIDKKKKNNPTNPFKEDIEINHSIFHELFAKTALPDFNTSYMWSIPIIGAAVQAENYLSGQGAIFILIAYKTDNHKNISFPEKHRINIGRTISYIVKDLFIPYLYTVSKDLVRQASLYSLKSAVSAIMGRNMSHNIGSHVMARISSGGIDGWTSNKTVNDIIKELDVVTHRKRKDIIEWSKDIQYLSRYIQQRMDFIAQVSTEWPSWTEPAYLMNDLMRWFLSQKHLLNHIAASEGLQAHSFINDEETDGKKNECSSESDGKDKFGDIRFHVFIVPVNCWNKGRVRAVEERKNIVRKSKTEQQCIIYPTKSCESCPTCRSTLLFTPRKGNADFRFDEDILLAIPGGIVGYHAFYIILENIIRNGAKHDYTKGGYDHFDVVIEVLYDPDETIAIQNEDKKIPAYLFRMYNNTGKIGENFQKVMNNVLKTSVVTETGELNKGNWGLAEMKIAAGYLQQRDLSHIGKGEDRITGKDKGKDKEDNFKRFGEDTNGSDAIIRAVRSPIGTLGYEFYIPKPRIVGSVCREGNEEEDNGR
jgi:hypothetical protein